jgi:phosphate transport system permease protein
MSNNNMTLVNNRTKAHDETAGVFQRPPRFLNGEAFNTTFKWLSIGAALFILMILGGFFVSLTIGAWPAIKQFGFSFIWTSEWNPVTEEFGALPAIAGTLITSGIAILLAVPLAFAIAVYITQLAPKWLRHPLGIAIELLAAIPSIIYGM